MKRALTVAAILELFAALALFHTDAGKFIAVHPWWRSSIAALPGIASVIFAYLEWRDSGRAMELREENSLLHREANELRAEANNERERANNALAQIAANTTRTPTQAERTADRLKPYLGKRVHVVNTDNSAWPEAPEIVEIKDEVVTLFTPSGYNSTAAFENHVHCDNLQITDGAVGSLPLTLKVLQRYGMPRNLGEIKTWEDRIHTQAEAKFLKGTNAFRAEYTKEGSPEKRSILIFEALDESNSYLIEQSTGTSLRGDNQEISRKFLQLQLEYKLAGFRWNGGGSGGNKYALFLTSPN